MSMLADATSAVADTPTATSLANSVNPANAIVDIPGMLNNYLISLKEMKTKLTILRTVVDSADPIYVLLGNGLTAIGS